MNPLPPTLDELGDRLDAAYRRAEARERAARRQRRTLAVVVTGIFLLVPTAIATRSIWAPDESAQDPARPHAQSRPVILANGEARGERWELSGFTAISGVCLQFAVGTLRSIDCSRPAEDGWLDLRTVTSPRSTFVFGAVEEAITAVTVDPPNGRPVPVTPVDPPATALARAQLTRDFRVYVGVLAPLDFTARVRATGRDVSGRVRVRYPAGQGG